MINGTIISTSTSDDVVRVKVRENNGELYIVHLEADAPVRCVSEGDALKCAEKECHWTPKMRTLRGPRDVKLVRIALSAGVSVPKKSDKR